MKTKILIKKILLFLILAFVIWNIVAIIYPYPKGREDIPIRGMVIHFPPLPALKELARYGGANFVEIKPLMTINPETGQVSSPLFFRLITKVDITIAHSRGLKVFLMPFQMWRGRHMVRAQDCPEDLMPKYLQTLEENALKWAEFAEKNGVEMFSPVSEPHRFIGVDRTNEFYQKILPKIKEIYQGEVVYAFAPNYFELGALLYYEKEKEVRELKDQLRLDFTGFDYIAPTLMPNQLRRIEDVEPIANIVNEYIKEIKSKYQVGFIWGEIGVPEVPDYEENIAYWTSRPTPSDVKADTFKELVRVWGDKTWIHNGKEERLINGFFWYGWQPFMPSFEYWFDQEKQRYHTEWQNAEPYRVIEEFYRVK